MEFSIEKLLQKYQKFVPVEEKIREHLVVILKDVVGVEVEKSAITYINGRIFIQDSPHLKGVVYRNKDRILDELQQRIKVSVQDIR